MNLAEIAEKLRVLDTDPNGVLTLADERALLAALRAHREALQASQEFVEMASAADNSGQEYDPSCQECEDRNGHHIAACKLVLHQKQVTDVLASVVGA